MSWADRLLPASLGGAPFLALNCKAQVGRRVMSIDIPGSDTPEHEDTGRRARRFSLTAIILGADYDRDRAKLVDILESPGPHTFVHPWWGEQEIIVEEAGEFEESAERGGCVTVSLSLTEAGKTSTMAATIAPSAVLANAVTAAGAAAAAEFEKSFVVGLADSFGAASAAIGSVSDKIDSVNNKIAAALGIADGTLAALDELKDQAKQLIGAPGALASTLLGLLAGAMALLGLTSGVEEEYPGQAAKVATDTALAAATDLGAFDVTAVPPYPGGPLHPQTRAATKAITKAVQTLSLVGVAGLFKTLPLESSTAAGQVLSTLSGLMEKVLADPDTSDDLTVALTDLRAALQQHLDALTGKLPTTVSYTPPAATPALLIAWQLQGDPTKDIEICARNGVLDPNFVPGGEPLEILDA